MMPAPLFSLSRFAVGARILLVLAANFHAAVPCRADDPLRNPALPDARPVPRYQAIPLPHDQISLQRDGIELTRLHFSPSLDRPFLYPVTLGAPDAAPLSLTRMGHPHDPVTHSHHNSIWISHHDVDGIDFWSDLERTGTGRIRRHHVERLFDGDAGAGVTLVCHWNDEASQSPLLEERRTIRALPAHDSSPESSSTAHRGWLLVIDLEFSPPSGRDHTSTTFRATPFGLIGVRMAKTIGVHDGGGRILNSDRLVNEEPVFRKPARWVDYSGPLARSTAACITLLDHPDNPGHPTPFHVRNDGWMGACLTLHIPLTVSRDRPLTLRYGLWIHDGVPHANHCDDAWNYFRTVQSPPARDDAP